VDRVAKAVVSGDVHEGDTVRIDVVDDELAMNVE
jgi:hypothetical protein